MTSFSEAPKFDDKGEVATKPYVTRLHNGRCVHNARKSSVQTGHKMIGAYKAPRIAARFSVYEHGNRRPASRNIWIRPLGEYDAGPKAEAKTEEKK